jgi:hypothetical protein
LRFNSGARVVSCAQVERQRDKFENTKVRERNEIREKKSVRLPFLSPLPLLLVILL